MRLLFYLLFLVRLACATERPPNFVVIFCDDLGYGDLGCFGNSTIETPHLDRLAQEGQKWTQFYVADPLCTPSRAGLLTGRDPVRSGMSSAARGVLFPDSAGGLPTSEVTIAEVLKQKDYFATAIGKWHLGNLPQHLPMEQGFDSYYGIPYSNDMDRVVVFTSDNGPWLGFRTHGGSAGPLRSGKGTTFEGGQRVPTIFWGPGYVKPGTVTEMGSTLDLLPTFASLAGAKTPTDRIMDGYDLSPLLMGEGESPRKDFYYWTRAKLHAVRSGPWKLHVQQRETIFFGRVINLEKPELYNVETDISEAYDVADAHPEIVNRLLRMLEAHEVDTADSLPDQLAARIE